MKVMELMTRDVVTVAPSATLKDAASLLVKHGISGMPVVDGTRVVGVFSERDLLFKEQGLPETARWLGWLTDPIAVADRPKLEAHTVGEAMTAPAITVEEDANVSAAAGLMLGAGVSRLPVLHDGTLVGIVTRADLVRAFVRTDEDIAREIREEIVVHTMWLDEDAVDVAVDHGEVTVSGRMKDRFDEDLFTKLVGRVPGVVSVNTHLELV